MPRASRQTPAKTLRRLSTFELVVAACALIALGLIAWTAFDALTSGLKIHDTATDFAVALRRIETTARDRNAFLTVRVRPPTLHRPTGYVVEQESAAIDEHDFPKGIAVVGEVTFDPQGVPAAPASFFFRRGRDSLTVVVNSKGEVSIP